MSKKTKKEWLSFTDNDGIWMICKHCQNEYVQIDEGAVAVTCSSCVQKRCLALKPIDEFFAKKHKKTGRPAGWHWMAEFVDKDGNVFHKGKEQPELKGTLKPTKVVPAKKRKKLTKDERMFKRAKEYKKKLKQKRKQNK
jgi:hypothetical protein